MSAVDRTAPPAPAPVRTFDFPEVRAGRMPNGLELRVVRLPRLPLVSALWVAPACEAVLGDQEAGTAGLAAAALEGGTRRRSGSGLAEALDGLGTSIDASAGWDATMVGLTCLADRLPEAMALLAEVVRESTFPDGEVERLRDQQLARIRQRRMDPAAMASDWAAHLFFAEEVPYGRPLGGTVASMGRLGAEALRVFVADRYGPGGAGLVLVGDVDFEEALATTKDGFGDWQGRSEPDAEADVGPRYGGRTVHLVDRPGAVQSELRVGGPGVARDHADYFLLVVANAVLGGTFTSRLNQNLRERNGYTYGVHSRFAFRRGRGPFSVSTSVGSDVTAPAVREILAELERFRSEGPSASELDAARDYLAGVFPLRFETTYQVASRVAELLVYRLPDDHHARYRDLVRGVGLDDAAGAAARHLRPEEMTVVVVGDADSVRGPLEALELGPLEVHVSGEGSGPYAPRTAP